MCVLAAIALLAGYGAAPARADGDPASDVLAEQAAFIPVDGSIPLADQARVQTVVRAAARRGYPVRVAVIATRADLGAVTALWGKPAAYAGFLGRELSLTYRGALVVVMPTGYGVDLVGGRAGAGSGAALHAAGASLEGLPLPGHGGALAGAAVTAVRRVAATAGHPLPAPRIGTLPHAAAGSGPGVVAWIALAAGAALIAAAWTASVRARPLRRGDGVASGGHGARTST